MLLARCEISGRDSPCARRLRGERGADAATNPAGATGHEESVGLGDRDYNDFVASASGNTVLGNGVHVMGANLHLDGDAMHAEQGRMQ